MENRFRMLIKAQPERAGDLLAKAQRAATQRYEEYSRRARGYEAAPADGAATVKPPVAEAAKAPPARKVEPAGAGG